MATKVTLSEYTLRFHKDAVTDVKTVVDLTNFKVPVLISGDGSGKLVIWNVITRRVQFVYEIPKSPQILAIEYLGDLLVAVLSKDHKLRILQLQLDESKTLVKTNEQSQIQQQLYKYNIVFEVPVNTLNFANFSLEKIAPEEYRLVCCNTQNAESIDIYAFKLNRLNSLKRLNKGINFYKTVIDLLRNTEISKFDKLGIVMKFLRVNDLVYCGFESGIIICFRYKLRQEVMTTKYNETSSKQSKLQELIKSEDTDISIYENMLEIVYISTVHYPNPILDLSISAKDEETVLSSSTDSKIGIHKAQITNGNVSLPDNEGYIIDDSKQVIVRKTLGADTSFVEVPVTEIGSIKSLKCGMVLGGWNGKAIVVDNNNEILKIVGRTKSNILVNESAIRSIQNDSDSIIKMKKNYKIKAVDGIDGVGTDISQLSNISRGDQRRLDKFLSSSWCIVGFDDGCITLDSI
ncbi:hypothetical protein Kpol_538p13 [Vanderwaltozyma polyspora DSM 70294]|uniref:ASTRA-associated protein 1 n=1 Tax=Vanderwaltozyma polyspora (strain ATCC 22028 / DSM 70294 / BCRC 21397 / CBS 2163 / NBRC 10782 / NRRL Y-8283 / UCD 57-17) TaxID=436907 RepID=ASA1_VANPO|nr:uncharacterized protein Kpol_538p13 [Vanderwaltozyma polyspora DSM 70294]A7TKC6.1 RecName: Full=ASTRA-associated protein 1 [Vanderwaltozyma polyspora DSM 70294]EDO17253.1 hypothetical protein Kpol_538p13 [Vanderwaltozyma polyspora DSM 70294]